MDHFKQIYNYRAADYQRMTAVEDVEKNLVPALERVTPLAGKPFLTRAEIGAMVDAYHAVGMKCGLHTEGEEIVKDFIDAGGDVVHHGHNMPAHLLDTMAAKGIPLVATPVGGTSSRPNSPEEILEAVQRGVKVAIATDSVLPPHSEATWLPFEDGRLVFSDDLMTVARPGLRALVSAGIDENQALALITLHAASMLGLEQRTGSLEPGKDADIVACDGVPALEACRPEDVRFVMSRGKVVHRN
jgi:imidazolonepropionase-like amidohydrolase